MQMVDSFTSRSGPLFLHFDGEFASGEDLVIGTMTGRNFGWLPSQYNQAIAHIAQVIREDDGSGQLAADRLNGLSYAVIFKGTDSRIPSSLRYRRRNGSMCRPQLTRRSSMKSPSALTNT